MSKDIRGKLLCKIQPVFTIGLHQKDLPLLLMIQKYFGGVGKIYIRKQSGTAYYNINSLKDIIKYVIPHLDNWELVSKKKADYILFREVVILMSKKEHLSNSGIAKIISLKASLNLGLKGWVADLFANIEPTVRPEVKLPENLNPYWVSGFICAEFRKPTLGHFVVAPWRESIFWPREGGFQEGVRSPLKSLPDWVGGWRSNLMTYRSEITTSRHEYFNWNMKKTTILFPLLLIFLLVVLLQLPLVDPNTTVDLTNYVNVDSLSWMFSPLFTNQRLWGANKTSQLDGFISHAALATPGVKGPLRYFSMNSCEGKNTINKLAVNSNHNNLILEENKYKLFIPINDHIEVIKNLNDVVLWGTNLCSTAGTGRLTNIVKNMIALPFYQKNVIVGILLSDGYLFSSGKSVNYGLYFKQGILNSKYVWFVYSILCHYCNVYPTLIKNNRNGQISEALYFRTRGLPCLSELRSIFYINKKKVIPEDIYNLLTPVALAHFIMGDGSVQRHGLILCTDSYELKDIVRLMNVLILKYDIACKLRYHTPTQPRIYISERSMPIVRNLVKPYITESMLYKIKL